MSLEVLLVLILISAMLSAYTRAYQRATLHWGQAIAPESGLTTGLQNAITPRVQTRRNLASIGLSLTVVALGVIEFGWLVGVGIVVGRFLLSAAVGAALPDPQSDFFARSILRSLIKRRAEFATGCDQKRTDMIDTVIGRFRKVAGVPNREAGGSQPQVGIRRKIDDTQWHVLKRSTVKFEFSSPDEEAVFRRAIAAVDAIVDLPSWLRDISDDNLADLLRNGPLRTLEEMIDWELARREWIYRNGMYVELFRANRSGGDVTSLERITRVGDDSQRIKMHTRMADAGSSTSG